MKTATATVAKAVHPARKEIDRHLARVKRISLDIEAGYERLGEELEHYPDLVAEMASNEGLPSFDDMAGYLTDELIEGRSNGAKLGNLLGAILFLDQPPFAALEELIAQDEDPGEDDMYHELARIERRFLEHLKAWEIKYRIRGRSGDPVAKEEVRG